MVTPWAMNYYLQDYKKLRKLKLPAEPDLKTIEPCHPERHGATPRRDVKSKDPEVASLTMPLQGVPRHRYFPANMQDGDGAAADFIFKVKQ